eukprot:41661_1
MSDVDVLNLWSQQWYTHHCGVIHFFERMNASHNLLIFDVENDSVHKMIQFFSGFGLKLRDKYWRHAGRTQPYKHKEIKQIHKWKRRVRSALWRMYSECINYG